MNRIFIGAAVWLGATTAAFCQVPNYPQTMPSDTFVGRIQAGSGPSSAIAIQSLLSRVIPPNSVPNSSLAKAPAATFKGNPTGSTANVRDFTIQGLPNRGAPDANNDKLLIFDTAAGVFKYVLPGAIASSATSGVSSIDGATNALTLQSGSLKVIGTQISSNVLSSRTFAITQNLSSFSSVQTLGYAAPGDGGGATFKNVGSSTFTDSYITGSPPVAGGSGYGVNATYLGVRLTGGIGLGCMGKVTVTSGAVSAIDISGTLCPAYAVGDALSPFPADMAGTGSGAILTVISTSTALGSFVDSVGTHFQYVVDSGGFPNVRQFSCKLDWNGNDADATNDLNCFNSVMAFAMVPFSTAGALVYGNTVIVPKGSAFLCAAETPFATMVVPQGVTLRGMGPQTGTSLKQCTASDSASHFIALCDHNAQLGQFGCKLQDLSLITDGAANNAIMAVYSNSGQQFPLLENVYIQNLARGCILYEIGKGGASNAIFQDIDCELNSANTNSGVIGNSSNTQVILYRSNFGCAPSNCVAPAIVLGGGTNGIIDIFHIEEFIVGMSIGATGLTTIKNGTITTGCMIGISLELANLNDTVLAENIQSSCSTATVNNGHPSGSSVTGNILKQMNFAP